MLEISSFALYESKLDLILTDNQSFGFWVKLGVSLDVSCFSSDLLSSLSNVMRPIQPTINRPRYFVDLKLARTNFELIRCSSFENIVGRNLKFFLCLLLKWILGHDNCIICKWAKYCYFCYWDISGVEQIKEWSKITSSRSPSMLVETLKKVHYVTVYIPSG